MLKYRLEKVIDCQDWDDLVTKTYGKRYCFQQQDGCQSRGSYHLEVPYQWNGDYINDNIPFEINGNVMGVSFNAWLNTTEEDVNNKIPEEYKGQNNLFWERNFYPNLETLSNDLYKRGLIEEGVYTINIDW